jgi:predicted RNase H-like HicB family nuclease
VIELPYSLIIEATEEPDFFGFYSPDLEGFTGIGHSVEDCLYQAKWGMQEFLQVMAENNMAVPPASKDPTITIKNMSRIEASQDSAHQNPPAERLALSN